MRFHLSFSHTAKESECGVQNLFSKSSLVATHFLYKRRSDNHFSSALSREKVIMHLHPTASWFSLWWWGSLEKPGHFSCISFWIGLLHWQGFNLFKWLRLWLLDVGCG